MKLRHVIDRTWLKLQIILTLFRFKKNEGLCGIFLRTLILSKCALVLYVQVWRELLSCLKKVGRNEVFFPELKMCLCVQIPTIYHWKPVLQGTLLSIRDLRLRACAQWISKSENFALFWGFLWPHLTKNREWNSFFPGSPRKRFD